MPWFLALPYKATLGKQFSHRARGKAGRNAAPVMIRLTAWSVLYFMTLAAFSVIAGTSKPL